MKGTGTLVDLLTHVGTVFPIPGWEQPGGRLAEEPVAVPPGLAQAGRQGLRLSLLAHPTCPMMGIPKITSTGSRGSAQHHLHAARDLKPELPRAGATARPSLLALAGMALVKWEALAQGWSYVSLTPLPEPCSCSRPGGRASPQQDIPLMAERVW